MMIVFCVLVAPILSYVTFRSRSVIAAAIAHGTINGTGVISIMMISGGNDLLAGATGLAGFIVLAAINAVIFLSERRSGRLSAYAESPFGV